MPDSKFEGVSVGDTVYVSVSTASGFSSGPSFFLPKSVARVTAKQFVTEGGDRYRKADGRFVCSQSYWVFAYNLGDKLAGYGVERTVEDQTVEYNEYQKRTRHASEIIRMLDNMRVPAAHPNLYEIHDLATQITTLLKSD